MAEEKSEKRIGTIRRQFNAVGGKNRSDAQAPEPQNVETSSNSREQVTERPTSQATSSPMHQSTTTLDATTSNISNSQTFEQLDVQTPKTEHKFEDTGRLNAETSSVFHAPTPERLSEKTASDSVAQPSKRERVRVTAYLSEENNAWVREYALKEQLRLKRRVEISDVVNEAVETLRRLK